MRFAPRTQRALPGRCGNYRKSLFVLLLLIPLGLWPTESVLGQAKVIQGIRALDTNYNKHLDPHEITNRSRPLLKKYAPYDRIDMLRPTYLGRWEEAVYRYYERRRSGDKRVRPETPSPLTNFDQKRDDALLPGFGLGDVKYPYSQRDLDEADDTIRRADRNDDGYVDREESKRSEWTRTSPFSSDYNKDNRLSRIELAQRYAARRALVRGAERRYHTMRRDRDGLGRYDESGRDSSNRGRDKRVQILSNSLLARYDRNRNRTLELSEVRDLRLNMRTIDLDANNEVSQIELENWIATEIAAQRDDAAQTMPDWFFERDANRDFQIQMSEFTDAWSDEKLQEFNELDLNDDGIITVPELGKPKSDAIGAFSSQDAVILPPNSTIVSEIEVNEDLPIGDLNLRLSITHTSVGQLDAYVIGPDGHRTELFTGVGKDGDHFEDTVFDDDSKTSILKARPPFRGHFQPEAMAKKQSGLNRYRKKNAQGLWQLMVRASRSDRPGILHAWSINVNSKPPSSDSNKDKKSTDEKDKGKDDRDDRQKDNNGTEQDEKGRDDRRKDRDDRRNDDEERNSNDDRRDRDQKRRR